MPRDLKFRPEWTPSEYGKLLRVLYSEEFFRDLSERVPHSEREWRHDHWWIADTYEREVRSLVTLHFMV